MLDGESIRVVVEWALFVSGAFLRKRQNLACAEHGLELRPKNAAADIC
jgi:hypothetical protein